MNPASRIVSSRARVQRGMSLIELLIAITIGLFIVLGLATVFINMKNAFVTQDQLGQLQDTERLALTMLSNAIRQSGYVPAPQTTAATADLPSYPTASPTYAPAQGIYGTSPSAGVSETLSTRFVPGTSGAIADCLGNTTYVAGDKVINTYTVNTNNELTCTVTKINGATVTTTGPIALVGNVASMAVLYGTDPVAACPCTVGQYLTAAQVTAATAWLGVMSARLTLTFVNPYTTATISRTQMVNLMNK